ncbi:hypothetical protein J5N97_013802 [Dioscorea zingiberensis]|uniref:E3 ubiquitin-protein ligase listerin n=1 Tax=Dioscorea zingiberensis TaxID=325984 RepID=A0A9D5CRX7_9LILI|nr:hypothetical protein J5N97_013802 [Dioscorea zingiberensis]
MGKQKGEGARSKNRPSSSSLAASLLPPGASTVGFGGYLGSSKVDASSSSVEGVAPFSDVDAEVALHLKRLGRKDPTTKLKALTSLCSLFKQRSGEEIVQIVPRWTFEYRRLLLDYNQEVRRATHETMTYLVTTVRKGLAPHLKPLMGPWWFSQFDLAPEVSQAAKRSLEVIFPAQEKRLEGLTLCINEIFLYLDENLKLTPQSMSDKATPLDELEEIHKRVIASSLFAVASLIDVLLSTPQNHESKNADTDQKFASKARKKIVSHAEQMFSVHKYFLEFLKSRKPEVRSAAYSILASFIKHIPHVFNEGNMKTLSAAILGAFQEKDVLCHSTMWDMILLFSRKIPEGWSHCNIEKAVLNRFWNFLSSGCYGSQQISYPVLVLFLDSMPSKAAVGEQFVSKFFQHLWDGRNAIRSLAECLALFKAFKECFLWALYHPTRYSVEEDAFSLSSSIIDDVLVRLLWHDYILFLDPKDQCQSSSRQSTSSSECVTSLPHGRSAIMLNTNLSYIQELGKCIVGILSDISSKNLDLLNAFCSSVRKDCLNVFQQGECLAGFSDNVQRIADFFSLLDEFSLRKGETWPLHCLAGPMVANSFEAIKSLDSPDAVKLLSTLVKIFGPTTIVSYLNVHHGEQEINRSTNEGDTKTKSAAFLHIFRNEFVPWCLKGQKRSCSSKLDLLIDLIQAEYFSDQWCSVIGYATQRENWSVVDTKTSSIYNDIEILAILIEKVRERIDNNNLGIEEKTVFLSQHWQHKLLDKAAVFVACHSPLNSSYAHFLRVLLGGSTENDQSCFLSREAIRVIFNGILRHFVELLRTSPFEWAKSSCSFLFCAEFDESVQILDSSFSEKLEMARVALQVLEGSIYCLRTLDEDCKLVPCILAAIFIIDWECIMASEGALDDEFLGTYVDTCSPKSGNVIYDHQQEQVIDKLAFGRELHAFRCGISSSFWRSLSSCRLLQIGNILVQVLRFSVFEMDGFSASRTSALCCEWALDMLNVLCHDHDELQNMLDQLLCEDKSWPLWAKPVHNDGERSAVVQVEGALMASNEMRHHNFITFVDKLTCSLGFSRVIAGVDTETPISSEVASVEPISSSASSYPRIWLAAEILCTWRWPDGDPLTSFLPSLSKFTENLASSEDNIVFSIVKLLLDGSLVNGVSCQWVSFNAWALSYDEIENIEDPFLRSLMSMLLTLIIKDKVWGEYEALTLLRYVLDKLYGSTPVDRACLRILPYVLCVIIPPLLSKSCVSDEPCKDVSLISSKEDLLHKNILNWLETANSFPPFAYGQTGPDVLEWIQVVISCFPLCASGGAGKLIVEFLNDIVNSEKTLLLHLLRKQQCGDDALLISFTASADDETYSPLPVQMTLAKLIAVSVGYCWQEFAEGDWNFVLAQSHKWMKSLVLLMEETVESIDDTAMKYKTKDKSELSLEKLDAAIQALDSLQISICTTALVTYCVFSQLFELEQAYKNEVLQSLVHFKDEMMEDILRIFFATAVAEAISGSFSEEASSIIASSRLPYSHFWELVAVSVRKSPCHVRNAAMQSMELWGLSKGPVSSLFAILFSSKPNSSLQLAAYSLLTTEPARQLSIFKDKGSEGIFTTHNEADMSQSFESTSEEPYYLRDEVSFLIQQPAAWLIQMDLLASDRVNVFLAWALLLSHLHSLPPSSSARERLIQYIQDSVSSTILDCLFQHIPLKVGTNNMKKKEVELPVEVSKAANSAKQAITSCSLLSSIESLWPIGSEQMAALAGSIYGLMIRLLPAYVRNWFASLRDRSLSSAIESFTKMWCSPSLISDELSQVKEAVIADENFFVTVNKSSYEITATYKKEETGMDLVIRLSSSYPLRPVDVECTRSLGISEVKQRKWLLSLSAFVRSQNGAIAEAIRIWKSNFDKEFQGVEECPICYSIIHTTNHSLPRLACKTCKHKFHSACLYKWFSTSHKSTCPLCQTPF